jgi:hypothetical protein
MEKIPNRFDKIFGKFLEQGQAPDTEVGRVYVYDLDDWDLPDKKFYWDTKEHPNFSLHQDTGMLTMRHGTRDGKYHLRFRVYDRKHTQVDVPANVTIVVREITHEAVTSSGSIRIAGISDEDFIRIWDYRVSFELDPICPFSPWDCQTVINHVLFFFL